MDQDSSSESNFGGGISTISTVSMERKDPLERGAGQGVAGATGKFHRPLDQVTCFKCGEKGHYANKCPKGYFLSPALSNLKRSEPES